MTQTLRASAADAEAYFPLAANEDGRRRRMLVTAFLAQNCAIGANFGIYGPSVEAIQHAFATSRALASSGMAVMTLVMGLASPMVSHLLHRFGIRRTMIGGALLNIAGYALMGFATNIWMLLVIYALILGVGVASLGVIPSSTLITHWFAPAKRGLALGVVNMPLFVCLFPFLSARAVLYGGLGATHLLAMSMYLLLLPLLWFVVDRPQHAATDSVPEMPSPTEAPDTTWQLLSKPLFLALCLGIGTLTAAGVMIVTHIVPLGLDRGLSLQVAALPLSAFGFASAIGSLIYGWLADRVGCRRAFATMGIMFALPWAALLVVGGDARGLVIVAACMGVSSGGILPLFAATVNAWFGQRNMSAGMGAGYLFKVPFMFGAAPLAGYMMDRTGSYAASIWLHGLTVFAIGVLFLFIRAPAHPRA